jgi:hypothetical protein
MNPGPAFFVAAIQSNNTHKLFVYPVAGDFKNEFFSTTLKNNKPVPLKGGNKYIS